MMVFKICFLSANNWYVKLKKHKGTDYVLRWKLKGVYTSKHKPLYTIFLHSIKLSGYKVGMKFYKDPFGVEPNNYATKIVNAYVFHDLDAWPGNPTDSLKFKICLFGRTNILKILIQKNGRIVAMEQHLVVQIYGILIMTFLGML